MNEPTAKDLVTLMYLHLDSMHASKTKQVDVDYGTHLVDRIYFQLSKEMTEASVEDNILHHLKEVWGPRCKTKDTEDELYIESEKDRCPSCVAYEKFDEFWSVLSEDPYNS